MGGACRLRGGRARKTRGGLMTSTPEFEPEIFGVDRVARTMKICCCYKPSWSPPRSANSPAQTNGPPAKRFKDRGWKW